MLTIKYERESYVDYGRVTSIVMDTADFVGSDNDTWEAVSEAQAVAYAQANLLACRFNHQQDQLDYMTKSCHNQMMLARQRMDMVWEWQKHAHTLQMALGIQIMHEGQSTISKIALVDDEGIFQEWVINNISPDWTSMSHKDRKEQQMTAAKWLYQQGYRPCFDGVQQYFQDGDTEDIPF